MDISKDVNEHYGRFDLGTIILQALAEAGKDMDNLTRDDLRTFDEFHIGGIVETRNLANKIPDTVSGKQVLDIGSGLGGPSRTLAAEFGAIVTGIDLTETYCQTATTLTERVGLADKITYHHGSALDMPFEADSFDVAWTQFVAMNIQDRPRLYQQVQRVLKPKGYFAFHEVLAGNGEQLHFPVLWADTPDISFLKQPDEMRQLLADAGFAEVVWNDLTASSSEWFINMAKQPPADLDQASADLNFSVFIGEETPIKARNILRNLQDGRIKVIQAVYQKQ